MTREVRGMLIGVCIVILAVAEWLLKEKPMNAPSATGTGTTAPEKK